MNAGVMSMFGKQWVLVGVMGLSSVALGAVAQGCSSEDDVAPSSDSGVDALADAIVQVTDTGVVKKECYSCGVMIDAVRRPTGQIFACDDNGDGGKSSKQLLDESFACVCNDQCAGECGDTCSSGAEVGGLCAACAGSKCTATYAACKADDPDLVKDSGVAETDSGVTDVDSGVVDSGIVDAAVGQ